MTVAVVAVLARKIEGGIQTDASDRRILDLVRDHGDRTVERKVVCAKRLLRLCERIKRIAEGRPLLELVKD